MTVERGGRWAAAAVVLLHFVAVAWWFEADRHLPDGDEAGHLGAIELYRDIARERGTFAAIEDAFTSPSEYPPLYALAIGLPLSAWRTVAPFPAGVGVVQAAWLSLGLIGVFGLAGALARNDAASSRRGTAGLPDASDDRTAASPMGAVTAERPGASSSDTGMTASGPGAAIGLGASTSDTGMAAAGSGAAVGPGASASAPGMAAARVGLLAVVAYATFPLAAGLSRHAMPEALLAVWVGFALWAGLETSGFTRTIPTVALALATAAGLLTKQTFALYVAGPLVVIALRGLRAHPRQALTRIALFVAIAVPLPGLWLRLHFSQQAAYGAQSAAGKAVVAWIDTLAYYPAVLVGTGLGLVWTAGFVIAVVALASRRRLEPLLWLALILLTLTAIPKKYPRLWGPALPLAAAVLAAGLGELRRARARAAVAGTFATAGLAQHLALFYPAPLPDTIGLWEPALLERVDPGCPQGWIRRLSREDLGFDAIVRAVRSERSDPPRIAFIAEPEIPCGYETTFGYTYHLAEYARRRGLELGEISILEADPIGARTAVARAPVVVHVRPWCEGPDGKPRAGAPEAMSREGCSFRPQFNLSGRIEVASGVLRFTLYLYRRHSPSQE